MTRSHVKTSFYSVFEIPLLYSFWCPNELDWNSGMPPIKRLCSRYDDDVDTLQEEDKQIHSIVIKELSAIMGYFSYPAKSTDKSTNGKSPPYSFDDYMCEVENCPWVGERGETQPKHQKTIKHYLYGYDWCPHTAAPTAFDEHIHKGKASTRNGTKPFYISVTQHHILECAIFTPYENVSFIHPDEC